MYKRSNSNIFNVIAQFLRAMCINLIKCSARNIYFSYLTHVAFFSSLFLFVLKNNNKFLAVGEFNVKKHVSDTENINFLFRFVVVAPFILIKIHLLFILYFTFFVMNNISIFLCMRRYIFQ